MPGFSVQILVAPARRDHRPQPVVTQDDFGDIAQAPFVEEALERLYVAVPAAILEGDAQLAGCLGGIGYGFRFSWGVDGERLVDHDVLAGFERGEWLGAHAIGSAWR